MRKNIIYMILVASFVFCACSKQEVVKDDNDNPTKETISDEKEENKTDRFIEIKYEADLDPGSSYEFSINTSTNELNINVSNYSSVVDMPTEHIVDTVELEEELMLNLIALYDANVMDSGWAYSYCCTLEDLHDMDKYLSDDAMKTKEEVGEYWEDLYGEQDLNKDGILTYKEDFDYTLNLMLEDVCETD